MSAENLATVHRWFEEVWNCRSEAVIHELLTDESVCYDGEAKVCGPEEFKERQYRILVAAFPDLRVRVDASLVDGDQVVIRWTALGTHTGSVLGVAPTGRSITLRGMTWIRVQGGKLMEGWQSSNIADVFRELQA